ncbi:MAG: hypothetical protein E6G56_09980 [Actinobacteria bacterium]|nr:MAG: hypothetical protein E6G56_09980 [Actinomycetota bacterium]
MRPEQAIEAARRAVAARRDEGDYHTNLRTLKVNPTVERVSSDQLMEWSLIEPDPGLIISTRRWGAPISAVKRWLLHLLRQYHGQLESQQTRFNVHLLARMVELEDRLALVEDWLRAETPAGEQPAVMPRRGEIDDRYLVQEWIAGPARARHEWLPPVPGSPESRAAPRGPLPPGYPAPLPLPPGMAGGGPLEAGMPSPIAPRPDGAPGPEGAIGGPNGPTPLTEGEPAGQIVSPPPEPGAAAGSPPPDPESRDSR